MLSVCGSPLGSEEQGGYNSETGKQHYSRLRLRLKYATGRRSQSPGRWQTRVVKIEAKVESDGRQDWSKSRQRVRQVAGWQSKSRQKSRKVEGRSNQS